MRVWSRVVLGAFVLSIAVGCSSSAPSPRSTRGSTSAVADSRGAESGSSGSASTASANPSGSASGPGAGGSAQPGSYTGHNEANQAFTFYVSTDGHAVQDVAVGPTSLECTPGASSLQSLLTVTSIPVAADGSFASTSTRSAFFGHYPATYVEKFSGRFGAPDADGAVTAAGSWEQTITYTDSAPRTCATNSVSWTATRDTQPSQATGAPPAGSYSGRDQYGQDVPFFVSGDSSSVQDLAVRVGLTCSPGTTTLSDYLSLPSTPIGADGSFDGSFSQVGVFAHSRANFSYRLTGHFHGVDPTGVPRAAGTYEETVTYTDSAPRTCTTAAIPFTVTREAQPAQPVGPPAPGNYLGTTAAGGSFTYQVVPSGTGIANVSIDTQVVCTPAATTSADHLAIVATPVAADGSFAANTTRSGVFLGKAALFQYSFRGHFHAVDANGAPRAAGTFVETVTYRDQVAQTCTTDATPWTASRTG